MNERMDGWVVEWVGGWIGEWMDGLGAGGWVDGRTEEWEYLEKYSLYVQDSQGCPWDQEVQEDLE